jgi:LysM repeat protein
MSAVTKTRHDDASPDVAGSAETTDQTKMQAAISAAEHARAAEGGRRSAGVNELPYQVHAGDTIWGVAQRHHDGLRDLVRANPQIANPDRIRPGNILFVPTRDPGIIDTRRKVADAEAAEHSAIGLEAALRNPKLSSGMRNGLTERLAAAQGAAATKWATLQKSIEDELRRGAIDKASSDAAATSLVADIRARAPESAQFQKTVDAALQAVQAKAQINRQVQAIVANGQRQTTPLAGLGAINDGYAKAPDDVKNALLHDPGALKIIDTAVAWANQPLQHADGGITPQGQTAAALQRLDETTHGLDKTLAGIVVDRAVAGYEKFHAGKANGLSGDSPYATSLLVTLSGRISGTRQGDDAVSRLTALGQWNTDAVRNTIGGGADPAYALAVASQLKARGLSASRVVQTIDDGIAMRDREKIANGGSVTATIDVANRLQGAGLDGSGVLKVATDGMQQFKEQVTADVTKLAKHDSELAWLVQNEGAVLAPQQLNQAVAQYRKDKGAAWQSDEARLQQQIANDGSKLLNQMTALNQLPPLLSGSHTTAYQTLRAIANDPAAGLALSTAISTDPKLAESKRIKEWADVFALSKVGDIGRKYLNEGASAFVRRNVLERLQGIDFKNPASLAQAKQAILSLQDEDFARWLGVTKADTEKVVKQLGVTADRIAAAESEDQVISIVGDFEKKLSTDAALSKTFNKATLAGQLFRGTAIAFAGVSLINSYNKFDANPSDPQNGIKLLLDAGGFAQKNSELLTGLGIVSKKSAIGQFGGEWKLLGRASAGDLIAGISAVLDSISAVRAATGLGVAQSTDTALFSATTAVGGALTVAPAFGAAAWLGPIGLGVTAVGVVGKAIYDGVKDAHKYEAGSKHWKRPATMAPRPMRWANRMD